jgi:hypothetical protein
MFNDKDFQGVVEDVVIPTEEIVVEEAAEEAEIVEALVVEEPKKAVKKKEEVKTIEKIAVFSTRSVNWEGVGSVKRGYNILPQEQADKWLKRSHVRLATPEEVKEAFNG